MMRIWLIISCLLLWFVLLVWFVPGSLYTGTFIGILVASIFLVRQRRRSNRKARNAKAESAPLPGEPST
ncbi:hypothetical protein ACFSUD_15580 [Sulfitobacter aestuarii]|uniref:Uncharacterized protein n=1 Tax=Sulfitobacter aestuarii TaxID=2161676 RepID=A0ABW5U596_9RHOB